MRRLIDTAPRDGKFVILEEDASGKYNVACWSLEAGGWVAESGEPIKIAPMYWHPIGGQKYAQQGLDPDFSLRPDPDAPQQTTASAVAASRTVAPAPVTAAELELQTIPIETKRAWPTRLKFAASAIAAILVVAVFAVMHFSEIGSHVTRYASLRDSVEVSTIGEQGVKQAGQPSENEQGQKVLAEELANARLAVDELNQKLRAEAAAAAQSLAEEHERTVALTLAINAAREALTANTAQHRQALEDERARTAALTGELTTVQREIKTQAEQSQKAVDAAAKQKQAAEAATVELRQSLQQEQKKTAALIQEAKVAQGIATGAKQQRRALEEAQARTAALASELAGARREIETQAAQSQKVVEEAAKQKQAAEAATVELRQSLQQEQTKTAALVQEAKTTQASRASVEPERRALEAAQARAAALASELAGARREIETQAAQSQKVVEEALQQKQAAEAATVELRQSLQQEQTKTAALVQEAKTTQASTASVEPERRALEEAHRQALEDERARTAALTGELTTVQREIETQAAQSQKAVDEALQQKQAAEAATADLRQSLQQERQRVDMLSSEVRQKLKALAKLSRQESDKTASNQAADANAELRPSLPRKRGQRKGGTPDAETPGQSTGTAATEQGEPAGLLTRAKALVGQGNIRAARDVLELAVGTGSAQATFALAETYDPNVLATWRTRGTLGDVTKARDLYKKAYDAGIEAAKDRSQALVFSDGERKPASWFGREETVR
jgi:hypothetical protein